MELNNNVYISKYDFLCFLILILLQVFLANTLNENHSFLLIVNPIVLEFGEVIGVVNHFKKSSYPNLFQFLTLVNISFIPVLGVFSYKSLSKEYPDIGIDRKKWKGIYSYFILVTFMGLFFLAYISGFLFEIHGDVVTKRERLIVLMMTSKVYFVPVFSVATFFCGIFSGLFFRLFFSLIK